jgi:hypothetical protein
VPRALNALTEGAKTGGNLLELAVEAARHRATLGEISDAMEIVFGRHGTVPTPVKGVYGAAYAGDSRYRQVLDGVEAVTAAWAASPHAGRQDGPGRARSRRQRDRLGLQRHGLRRDQRPAVPDAAGSLRAGAGKGRRRGGGIALPPGTRR